MTEEDLLKTMEELPTVKTCIEVYKKLVMSPAGPVLIVQTLSGDISPFSWARKCEPARILAGQSELKSCIIVRKSWRSREKQTIKISFVVSSLMSCFRALFSTIVTH